MRYAGVYVDGIYGDARACRAADAVQGFFLYALDGSVVKSVTLEQPAPRPPLTLTPAK